MADIAETISFNDICTMLDKLKSAKTAEKKRIYLQRYYESFKKHRANFRLKKEIPASSKENGSSSFYSVLRCLIPSADKERKPYGLQITTLGLIYIKVLKLPADSRDALRLKEARCFGKNRDYADIIYEVLQLRARQEPSNLSLQRIHQMLDTIATENIRNTEMILTELSELASAREQMWFIRLLLKSMTLGIGEQAIFNILHAQAREIYKICSSLPHVCCLLAENNLTLDDDKQNEAAAVQVTLDLSAAVQPFHHVQPMLCEIFPGNVEAIMCDDVLYMETKQDGERFQLHYKDGRFEYISRNGINYTSSFGADYSSGPLTPLLQPLLPVGMMSIILDGEMMVWDIREQCYRDKGENTDVKHLTSRANWRPCFVVYDLLYLNGRSMLDMPYVRRTHRMRECLRERAGVLQTMKPLKITSLEDFKQKYQNALDANEEGVVLKKQNSIYRPGVRHGGGWYKVKADYIDGLTFDFDLIIMGGFYNKSRSYIESYLLGVVKYNSAEDFEVYSVAKVLNNTRRRRVLNDTLRLHWKQLSIEPAPAWYHYGANSAEGRPDVWIEPHVSAVLQTKATDLVPSSHFGMLKALHFPRIQCWRNDKVWHEATSLREYGEMCQKNRGIKKINKRELRLEDLTKERKKTRLTAAQRRQQVYSAFERKFDATKIKVISALFDGFCFCILSADLAKGYTPEQLKELVVKNGGEIVENPIPNDAQCICVAGEITFRVKKLQRAAQIDIVSMAWLLKTCKRQYMQLMPHDLVFATEELQEQFASSCDQYGDSYTQTLDEQDLLAIFDNMKMQDLPTHIPKAEDLLNNLELELLNNISAKFLRNYCGYFFNCDENVKVLFKFRGGTIYEQLEIFSNLNRKDQCVIFINISTLNNFNFKLWLENKFTSSQIEQIKILNVDWIISSHAENSALEMQDYLYK